MSRILTLGTGETPEEQIQRAAKFDKASRELGYAQHTLLIGAGGVGNAALDTAARSLLARNRRFGEYDRDTGTIVNAVQIDTDRAVFGSDSGRLLKDMGAKQVHLHLPRLEELLHRTGLKDRITPGRARGSDDKGAGASPKDGITRMNLARKLGLTDGQGHYLNPLQVFRNLVRSGLERFPMYDGNYRIDAFGGISGGTGPAIRIAIADAISAVLEVAPDLGVNSNLYVSTIETTRDTEGGRNVPDTLRKKNAFVQLLYILGEQHSRRTALLDGSIPHVPNMVYVTTAGNSRVTAPANSSYDPTKAVARAVVEGEILAKNTQLASSLMNARRTLETTRDVDPSDPDRDNYNIPDQALTSMGVATINPHESIPALTMAKKRMALLAASGLSEDPANPVALSEDNRALVDVAGDAAMPTDLANSAISAFNAPSLAAIDVERDEDSVNRANLAKTNVDDQINDMRTQMETDADSRANAIILEITQKAEELVGKGLNVERAYLEDLLVMVSNFDIMVENLLDTETRNQTDASASFDAILQKIQQHQNIPWIYNLFLMMSRARRRLAQERSDAVSALNAYSSSRVKAEVYGLLKNRLVPKLKSHVTQLLETNRTKEQTVRDFLTTLVPDPELATDVRNRFDLEAPVEIKISDISASDSGKLGTYSLEDLAEYVKGIVLTKEDVDIAGQVTEEYLARAERVARPFRGIDGRPQTSDESHVIHTKYYGIPGIQSEVDGRKERIAIPEGANVVALDPGTVSPIITEVDHQLSLHHFASILEGFDLLVATPPTEREVIFTENGDLARMLRFAATEIAQERARYEKGLIRTCAGNECGLPIFISAEKDRVDYKEQSKVSPAPYYCKGCRNH